MLRYLPFLFFLLVIDFLFWPIGDYWSAVFDLQYLKVLHFAIPACFVGLLYANDMFRLRKKNRTLFTQVYSSFQLLYICKAVGAIFLGLMMIMDAGFNLGGADLSDRWVHLLPLLVALIPFILLPYGIIFNRHRYQVRNVSVPIEGLSPALEGLTIVQISDLHSGSFFDAKGFDKGIQMINDLNPDLIFFTGDLVNNRAIEFEPLKETFRKMKAKYGIYSVLGNHDYGDYVRWESQQAKRQNLQDLIQTQRDIGWKVLLNENDIVEIGKGRVGVIGVQNYSAKLRFPKYGDLAAASQGLDDVDIQLLLSHDPSHWRYEVVPKFKDVAISFSGHTHGMQFGIEIGKWQWSPIKYVYKEWAGLYQEGQQYLYVNRGFGVLGYPGRVGILPEITFMTILAKK